MLTGEAWESWAAARPTNYFVMKRSAHELVESNLWAEAKPVLEKLAELYPDEVGGESSRAMLAATHRALGETDQEIAVLSALAEKDDTALPAYVRLMELESARADWQSVTTNVQRYLAVNPLVPAPYRFLAQASEKSGDQPNAILAYRSLIQLEGGNLAELHFRLAQALHEAGRPEARRETLLALEEAPRYRAALDLLITIAAENGNEAPPAKGVSPGTP